MANRLYPGQLDAQNVSVIRVGGKDQIAQLVKLVRKLGIECFLVADFDYFMRDQNEACRTFGGKPHESILSVGSQFFQQRCTFDQDGRAILTRIQRLRATIKRDEPEAFYTAKSLSSVGTLGLSEILQECREHGICILSGQIEDACTDGSFGPNKKLNLERLYSLSGRLAAGENIGDIFDTTEFEPFFRKLFGLGAIQRAGR